MCCICHQPSYCSGSGRYAGSVLNTCACNCWWTNNGICRCWNHTQSGWVVCPNCSQTFWSANGFVPSHYPKYTVAQPHVHHHYHLPPALPPKKLAKKRSSRW